MQLIKQNYELIPLFVGVGAALAIGVVQSVTIIKNDPHVRFRKSH